MNKQDILKKKIFQYLSTSNKKRLIFTPSARGPKLCVLVIIRGKEFLFLLTERMAFILHRILKDKKLRSGIQESIIFYDKNTNRVFHINQIPLSYSLLPEKIKVFFCGFLFQQTEQKNDLSEEAIIHLKEVMFDHANVFVLRKDFSIVIENYKMKSSDYRKSSSSLFRQETIVSHVWLDIFKTKHVIQFSSVKQTSRNRRNYNLFWLNEAINNANIEERTQNEEKKKRIRTASEVSSLTEWTCSDHFEECNLIFPGRRKNKKIKTLKKYQKRKKVGECFPRQFNEERYKPSKLTHKQDQPIAKKVKNTIVIDKTQKPTNSNIKKLGRKIKGKFDPLMMNFPAYEDIPEFQKHEVKLDELLEKIKIYDEIKKSMGKFYGYDRHKRFQAASCNSMNSCFRIQNANFIFNNKPKPRSKYDENNCGNYISHFNCLSSLIDCCLDISSNSNNISTGINFRDKSSMLHKNKFSNQFAKCSEYEYSSEPKLLPDVKNHLQICNTNNNNKQTKTSDKNKRFNKNKVHHPSIKRLSNTEINKEGITQTFVFENTSKPLNELINTALFATCSDKKVNRNPETKKDGENYECKALKSGHDYKYVKESVYVNTAKFDINEIEHFGKDLHMRENYKHVDSWTNTSNNRKIPGKDSSTSAETSTLSDIDSIQSYADDPRAKAGKHSNDIIKTLMSQRLRNKPEDIDKLKDIPLTGTKSKNYRKDSEAKYVADSVASQTENSDASDFIAFSILAPKKRSNVGKEYASILDDRYANSISNFYIHKNISFSSNDSEQSLKFEKLSKTRKISTDKRQMRKKATSSDTPTKYNLRKKLKTHPSNASDSKDMHNTHNSKSSKIRDDTTSQNYTLMVDNTVQEVQLIDEFGTRTAPIVSKNTVTIRDKSMQDLRINVGQLVNYGIKDVYVGDYYICLENAYKNSMTGLNKDGSMPENCPEAINYTGGGNSKTVVLSERQKIIVEQEGSSGTLREMIKSEQVHDKVPDKTRFVDMLTSPKVNLNKPSYKLDYQSLNSKSNKGMSIVSNSNGNETETKADQSTVTASTEMNKYNRRKFSGPLPSATIIDEAFSNPYDYRRTTEQIGDLEIEPKTPTSHYSYTDKKVYFTRPKIVPPPLDLSVKVFSDEGSQAETYGRQNSDENCEKKSDEKDTKKGNQDADKKHFKKVEYVADKKDDKEQKKDHKAWCRSDDSDRTFILKGKVKSEVSKTVATSDKEIQVAEDAAGDMEGMNLVKDEGEAKEGEENQDNEGDQGKGMLDIFKDIGSHIASGTARIGRLCCMCTKGCLLATDECIIDCCAIEQDSFIPDIQMNLGDVEKIDYDRALNLLKQMSPGAVELYRQKLVAYAIDYEKQKCAHLKSKVKQPVQTINIQYETENNKSTSVANIEAVGNNSLATMKGVESISPDKCSKLKSISRMSLTGINLTEIAKLFSKKEIQYTVKVEEDESKCNVLNASIKEVDLMQKREEERKAEEQRLEKEMLERERLEEERIEREKIEIANIEKHIPKLHLRLFPTSKRKNMSFRGFTCFRGEPQDDMALKREITQTYGDINFRAETAEPVQLIKNAKGYTMGYLSVTEVEKDLHNESFRNQDRQLFTLNADGSPSRKKKCSRKYAKTEQKEKRSLECSEHKNANRKRNSERKEITSLDFYKNLDINKLNISNFQVLPDGSGIKLHLKPSVKLDSTKLQHWKNKQKQEFYENIEPKSETVPVNDSENNAPLPIKPSLLVNKPDLEKTNYLEVVKVSKLNTVEGIKEEVTLKPMSNDWIFDRNDHDIVEYLKLRKNQMQHSRVCPNKDNMEFDRTYKIPNPNIYIKKNPYMVDKTEICDEKRRPLKHRKANTTHLFGYGVKKHKVKNNISQNSHQKKRSGGILTYTEIDNEISDDGTFGCFGFSSRKKKKSSVGAAIHNNLKDKRLKILKSDKQDELNIYVPEGRFGDHFVGEKRPQSSGKSLKTYEEGFETLYASLASDEKSFLVTNDKTILEDVKNSPGHENQQCKCSDNSKKERPCETSSRDVANPLHAKHNKQDPTDLSWICKTSTPKYPYIIKVEKVNPTMNASIVQHTKNASNIMNESCKSKAGANELRIIAVYGNSPHSKKKSRKDKKRAKSRCNKRKNHSILDMDDCAEKMSCDYSEETNSVSKSELKLDIWTQTSPKIEVEAVQRKSEQKLDLFSQNDEGTRQSLALYTETSQKTEGSILSSEIESNFDEEIQEHESQRYSSALYGDASLETEGQIRRSETSIKLYADTQYKENEQIGLDFYTQTDKRYGRPRAKLNTRRKKNMIERNFKHKRYSLSNRNKKKHGIGSEIKDASGQTNLDIYQKPDLFRKSQSSQRKSDTKLGIDTQKNIGGLGNSANTVPDQKEITKPTDINIHLELKPEILFVSEHQKCMSCDVSYKTPKETDFVFEKEEMTKTNDYSSTDIADEASSVITPEDYKIGKSPLTLAKDCTAKKSNDEKRREFSLKSSNESSGHLSVILPMNFLDAMMNSMTPSNILIPNTSVTNQENNHPSSALLESILAQVNEIKEITAKNYEDMVELRKLTEEKKVDSHSSPKEKAEKNKDVLFEDLKYVEPNENQQERHNKDLEICKHDHGPDIGMLKLDIESIKQKLIDIETKELNRYADLVEKIVDTSSSKSNSQVFKIGTLPQKLSKPQKSLEAFDEPELNMSIIDNPNIEPNIGQNKKITNFEENEEIVNYDKNNEISKISSTFAKQGLEKLSIYHINTLIINKSEYNNKTPEEQNLSKINHEGVNELSHNAQMSSLSTLSIPHERVIDDFETHVSTKSPNIKFSKVSKDKDLSDAPLLFVSPDGLEHDVRAVGFHRCDMPQKIYDESDHEVGHTCNECKLPPGPENWASYDQKNGTIETWIFQPIQKSIVNNLETQKDNKNDFEKKYTLKILDSRMENSSVNNAIHFQHENSSHIMLNGKKTSVFKSKTYFVHKGIALLDEKSNRKNVKNFNANYSDYGTTNHIITESFYGRSRQISRSISTKDCNDIGNKADDPSKNARIFKEHEDKLVNSVTIYCIFATNLDNLVKTLMISYINTPKNPHVTVRNKIYANLRSRISNLHEESNLSSQEINLHLRKIILDELQRNMNEIPLKQTLLIGDFLTNISHTETIIADQIKELCYLTIFLLVNKMIDLYYMLNFLCRSKYNNLIRELLTHKLTRSGRLDVATSTLNHEFLWILLKRTIKELITIILKNIKLELQHISKSKYIMQPLRNYFDDVNRRILNDSFNEYLLVVKNLYYVIKMNEIDLLSQFDPLVATQLTDIDEKLYNKTVFENSMANNRLLFRCIQNQYSDEVSVVQCLNDSQKSYSQVYVQEYDYVLECSRNDTEYSLLTSLPYDHKKSAKYPSILIDLCRENRTSTRSMKDHTISTIFNFRKFFVKNHHSFSNENTTKRQQKYANRKTKSMSINYSTRFQKLIRNRINKLAKNKGDSVGGETYKQKTIKKHASSKNDCDNHASTMNLNNASDKDVVKSKKSLNKEIRPAECAPLVNVTTPDTCTDIDIDENLLLKHSCEQMILIGVNNQLIEHQHRNGFYNSLLSENCNEKFKLYVSSLNWNVLDSDYVVLDVELCDVLSLGQTTLMWPDDFLSMISLLDNLSASASICDIKNNSYIYQPLELNFIVDNVHLIGNYPVQPGKNKSNDTGIIENSYDNHSQSTCQMHELDFLNETMNFDVMNYFSTYGNCNDFCSIDDYTKPIVGIPMTLVQSLRSAIDFSSIFRDLHCYVSVHPKSLFHAPKIRHLNLNGLIGAHYFLSNELSDKNTTLYFDELNKLTKSVTENAENPLQNISGLSIKNDVLEETCESSKTEYSIVDSVSSNNEKDKSGLRSILVEPSKKNSTDLKVTLPSMRTKKVLTFADEFPATKIKKLPEISDKIAVTMKRLPAITITLPSSETYSKPTSSTPISKEELSRVIINADGSYSAFVEDAEESCHTLSDTDSDKTLRINQAKLCLQFGKQKRGKQASNLKEFSSSSSGECDNISSKRSFMSSLKEKAKGKILKNNSLLENYPSKYDQDYLKNLSVSEISEKKRKLRPKFKMNSNSNNAKTPGIFDQMSSLFVSTKNRKAQDLLIQMSNEEKITFCQILKQILTGKPNSVIDAKSRLRSFMQKNELKNDKDNAKFSTVYCLKPSLMQYMTNINKLKCLQVDQADNMHAFLNTQSHNNDACQKTPDIIEFDLSKLKKKSPCQKQSKLANEKQKTNQNGPNNIMYYVEQVDEVQVKYSDDPVNKLLRNLNKNGRKIKNYVSMNEQSQCQNMKQECPPCRVASPNPLVDIPLEFIKPRRVHKRYKQDICNDSISTREYKSPKCQDLSLLIENNQDFEIDIVDRVETKQNSTRDPSLFTNLKEPCRKEISIELNRNGIIPIVKSGNTSQKYFLEFINPKTEENSAITSCMSSCTNPLTNNYENNKRLLNKYNYHTAVIHDGTVYCSMLNDGSRNDKEAKAVQVEFNAGEDAQKTSYTPQTYQVKLLVDKPNKPKGSFYNSVNPYFKTGSRMKTATNRQRESLNDQSSNYDNVEVLKSIKEDKSKLKSSLKPLKLSNSKAKQCEKLQLNRPPKPYLVKLHCRSEDEVAHNKCLSNSQYFENAKIGLAKNGHVNGEASYSPYRCSNDQTIFEKMRACENGSDNSVAVNTNERIPAGKSENTEDGMRLYDRVRLNLNEHNALNSERSYTVESNDGESAKPSSELAQVTTESSFSEANTEYKRQYISRLRPLLPIIAEKTREALQNTQKRQVQKQLVMYTDPGISKKKLYMNQGVRNILLESEPFTNMNHKLTVTLPSNKYAECKALANDTEVIYECRSRPNSSTSSKRSDTTSPFQWERVNPAKGKLKELPKKIVASEFNRHPFYLKPGVKNVKRFLNNAKPYYLTHDTTSMKGTGRQLILGRKPYFKLLKETREVQNNQQRSFSVNAQKSNYLKRLNLKEHEASIKQRKNFTPWK